MKKRILSLLLVFAMVIGMFPTTALATDGVGGTEDVVYLSVSYDKNYINDKNGNPIVYRAINLADVAAIDLTDYGLDNMLFDADGDDEYETTALQLIIYAHEKLYGGDWGDVNFDALPGSSYFRGGVFGFSENLVYFQNGDFPVDETQQSDYMTVGATSDRIVLEPGDFIDIASFGCYSFLWDQQGGFHLFADEDGNYVHDYTVEAGKALTVNLRHSFCDLMNGESWVKAAADFEVYYGSTYGDAKGSVTTDENGCAEITFPNAGTYYVWCEGGPGTDDGTHTSCEYYMNEGSPCIVSSPAYAKVTVTGGASEPTEPEEQECEHDWVEATCTDPKTCSKCGATEGEANGHKWVNGVCQECDAGCEHSWTAASCTEPKKCSNCGATEGEANGHSWRTSGTCKTCGATCKHENWENSKCTTCGKKCSTHTYENSICTTCGTPCPHTTWADGKCKKCGAVCEHENWKRGSCEVCSLACEHEEWEGGPCDGHCNKCNFTRTHVFIDGECIVCHTKGENEQVGSTLDVSKVLNDTLEQLTISVPEPKFGTSAGEWTVFSLARGNYFEKDNDYFTNYYKRIVGTAFMNASKVNMNGALDKTKSTENSRLIMALSSIGIDATAVGDVNLVEAYSANGMNWVKKQGINGTIWTLIALDTGNYETADSTIRQQCIDSLLSLQHTDGGWSLATNLAQPSNVDITGMTLTALYPYRNQPAVAQACAEAIAWMSECQRSTGGFPYGSDGETSESCAWAIVSLTMWGINPDTDPRFIKNGNSAVDNLLTYYVADEKMFAHQGSQSNAMATDQASYALVAYNRFVNGEKALYDMTDVEITKSDEKFKAVESVSVDKTEIVLNVGDTAELKAVITPADASVKDIKWTSSDKSIASVVADTGVVTAKAEGTATITVTTTDGSKTATCTVTVCDHNWSAESCGAICSKCGVTKEHSWIDATCTAPKTCSVCKVTEGEALGHSYEGNKCTLCDAVKPGASTGGSAGGSSAGGGGAAGGSTSLPTEGTASTETSKDNTTGENKVTATVEGKETTKGGETKVTVSTGVVNTAIQAAVEAAKKVEADNPATNTETKTEVKPEVKIEIKGDATTEKVETSIPVEATKEIVKNEGMALKLDTPIGEITFDSNALSVINDNAAGKDISFHVEKTTVDNRPAVELSVKTDSDSKVGQFGKGRVNVAIHYVLKPGEIGAGLIVRYVDDNGKKTDMPTTYDAKTGKVHFTTNHFSTYVVDYDEDLAKNAVNFTDVKSGDWFYESVMALASKGIISGKGDNTYAPNANITRAEFVTILANLSGQDMPTVTGKFTDVKSDDWFAKYVTWAANAGIVYGTSADKFSPNAKITRQDMAVMIKRYADFMKKEISGTNTAVTFTDAASIASYAKDAVTMMQKAGIINGIKAEDGNYSFAPANNATRAQAATMIYQLIK